jgi:hypothetical protein
VHTLTLQLTGDPPSLSQAHNRNLLSIDFDQSTRVGKIYDDHRKFTLHIQYDLQGRPVVWSPSSKYTEVNVSYSSGGLLTAIHRGDWSERLEYEGGRVVSRAWVNGKIWSYTYVDRVRLLLDATGVGAVVVANIKSQFRKWLTQFAYRFILN